MKITTTWQEVAPGDAKGNQGTLIQLRSAGEVQFSFAVGTPTTQDIFVVGDTLLHTVPKLGASIILWGRCLSGTVELSVEG